MEIRKIWTSTVLNDYVEFPHCGQVAVIERFSQELKSGKTRQETAYVITSLTPHQAGPESLLELNRGHWEIENRLHWVRDVTYDEDRSQIRTGNGPLTMACLRNFAISVLRLAHYHNIASALRELAARPHLALGLIRI